MINKRKRFGGGTRTGSSSNRGGGKKPPGADGGDKKPRPRKSMEGIQSSGPKKRLRISSSRRKR